MSETDAGPAADAPVLTPEMITALNGDIKTAGIKASVAATTYEQWRDRETNLTAVRDYIEPRLGRPVAEVLEEVQGALAKAEADLAVKAAATEALRERARDLQGYRRILEERRAELEAQAAEAPSSPVLREGEQG